MPQKKGKKKSGRKPRSNRVNIPSGAQSYKGPLTYTRSKSNQGLTVIQCRNSFAFTSSSGGVVSTVCANNLASFLDTTSIETLYDEWRCLSCEVMYVPNVTGGAQTALAYSVAVGVVDNDNATALPSFSSGIDYESAKVFSLDGKMKLVWRMAGAPDSDFLTDDTKPSTWFKFFCSGLTASSTYGQLIVTALFQVRGRI